MRLLSMVCGLLLNAIAFGSASQQSPQPEQLAPDVLALERAIESAASHGTGGPLASFRKSPAPSVATEA
jgi:hypothetical protein